MSLTLFIGGGGEVWHQMHHGIGHVVGGRWLGHRGRWPDPGRGKEATSLKPPPTTSPPNHITSLLTTSAPPPWPRHLTPWPHHEYLLTSMHSSRMRTVYWFTVSWRGPGRSPRSCDQLCIQGRGRFPCEQTNTCENIGDISQNNQNLQIGRKVNYSNHWKCRQISCFWSPIKSVLVSIHTFLSK